MIRFLSLILLMTLSIVANAQAPSNYTNINGRYRWIAGMFDSTFHIPKGTTPSLRTGGSTNPGAIFYNTTDSSVYTYTGTQWIKLRGSINPSDTTNKYVTQVYKKTGSDSIFYVKGGSHIFAFIDSVGSGGGGGGGGGKIYYFNGGVSMGTFGGFTMYELGDTANTGTAANFTRSTNGNIANFITDPGKPGLLSIPAGVWTIDAYLSETGGGSNNAEIYVQVEKWDGSTITTIATSPIEQITNGSVIDLYTWSVSIPTTSLAITDRIIIQFYIQNTNGKTVTLYTQNGLVGEVHTTFTTGIGALNGLTAASQFFATGTSGTDFNIASATATHTFNLPTASATNRGALSSADWTTFNNKLNISDTANMLLPYLRKVDTASLSNRINTKLNISDTATMLGNYVNNVGYGLSKVSQVVSADSATLASYFLRRKDSLTATNLLGYVTGKILADTAAAVRAAAGTIGGSGTTNRVSKFTASGTIGNSSIADSSSSVAMTILSNGNIGINTTAPNQQLEIVGTSRFTRTTSPSVHLNLSMENGFAEYDARGSIDHVWETSGIERMRLTFGGNLGVGTASPDSMLTVLEGARFQRGVRMSGLPSAPGTRALRIDANGTLSVADTTTGGGGGIGGSGTTNRIAKFTASGTIGNSSIADSSSSVAMTISSLGNVGIGTTSPSSKFDLVSSTNGNVFSITGLGGLSPNFIVQGNGEQTMRFYNNATTGSARTSIKFANRLNTDWNWIMYNDVTETGANNFTFTNHTNGVAYHINTSNQIGIGTLTVGSRFQVNGNAAIGYSASTAAPTNGLMVAGNVGVNVTPSAWASGFRAIQIGARTALFNSDINITTLGNNIFYDGVSYKYITSAAGSSIDLGGNYMTFGTIASGTAGANATGVERARIHTDGIFYIGNGDAVPSPNTGIVSATGGSGTNVAGAEFRIRGGASTGNAAGGIISFYTSAAGTAGTTTNAATERMRIDAAGNLGLGTITPALKFDVVGQGRFASTLYTNLILDGTNATDWGNNLAFRSQGVDFGYIGSIGSLLGNTTKDLTLWATSGNGVRFYTNGNNLRAIINSSGNVGIGTTTIGSTLQVNGNTVIGYSASTAAPTNGLAVSGNVTIGTTTAAGKFTIDPDDNQVGLAITGTSLTGSNAQSLIDLAGTWNTTGNPTAIKLNITNTASGTGADLMELQVGGVSQFIVGKSGSGYFKDMLTIAPQTANTSAIKTDGYSLTGSNSQALLSMTGTWNTTGNPTAISLDITNTASGASAYLMDLQVGGATQFRVTKAGAIRTTAPTGGTAANWKVGTVATVTPTSPNRTIEVEIDGVIYYIHAKTTNN